MAENGMAINIQTRASFFLPALGSNHTHGHMHACMHLYISHIASLSHLLLEKSSASSASYKPRFRRPPPYHCKRHWPSLSAPRATPTWRIYPRIPLHSPGRPSCRRQVILAARRALKTEAEVATMDAIRGMRTLLGVLVSSDPWLPSAYVDPCAASTCIAARLITQCERSEF